MPIQLERRRERYRRRQAVGKLIGFERVSTCGGWMVAEQVGVVVDQAAAHYRGVRRCGLVWLCPVCSPRIRQFRAVEITELLAGCVVDGLGLGLLTLTARHCRQQRLVDVFGGIEAAWKSMREHRAFRALSVELGVVGMVTFREVTYGDNGWHPHRHSALVFRRPYGSFELDAAADRVWPLWEAALGDRGLTATRRAGVDLRPASAAIGEYSAKVEGVGVELTRGDLKTGRGSGWTPEQLGQRVAGRDAEASKLLQEYAGAVTGRRMLSFSGECRRRRRAGLSDQEVVDSAVGGELVAMLTRRAWARVCRSGAVVAVLEAAEQGRYELGQVLDDVCAVGTWWIEAEEVSST